MTLHLFDTHTHLNSDVFSEAIDVTVERARTVGITGIAVIGVDAATSRRACDLAAEYPGFLHAVVGIQPNYVHLATEEDWEEVKQLSAFPGVRGIGETGIDCYWDDAPLATQQAYFDRHIEWSLAAGLPMVIHMRDSGDLIVEQLRRHPELPAGIMHSFTGSWEQARECLDLGLMISFAGMVTFKKNDSLRDVASRVPEDRLLVETDSPYLSPEPLRGKRPNEPARVEHTLRCVADARGVAPEALADQTTANARRIFQLR